MHMWQLASRAHHVLWAQLFLGSKINQFKCSMPSIYCLFVTRDTLVISFYRKFLSESLAKIRKNWRKFREEREAHQPGNLQPDYMAGQLAWMRRAGEKNLLRIFKFDFLWRIQCKFPCKICIRREREGGGEWEFISLHISQIRCPQKILRSTRANSTCWPSDQTGLTCFC